MKRVEIIKVTTGEAMVQSVDQMLYTRTYEPPNYIRNDPDILVDSTVDVQSMEIHRVCKFLDGVNSERLVAIHPDVAEILLIPEIKDKAIKAEIDTHRLRVAKLALREDRMRREFKEYRAKIYNAGMWSRIKYVFTGSDASFQPKDKS